MPGMIPTIIERWNQGAAVGYDIYSRLLRDRIIFIGGYGGAIDTDSANAIIAQFFIWKRKIRNGRSTFTSIRRGEW
jgi:ATP-dependent protease ClpP protease subunit